jgi:small conductance mechanosensitive channel
MSIFRLLIQTAAAANPLDSLENKFMGDVHHFFSMPVDQQVRTIAGELIDFGVKLLVCIVAIWLGKKLIRFIVRFLRKIMVRRHVESSISHFLTNLLRAIFWIVIVWVLIDYLGINTSSILALFASAGLAFGLALSGTLQNFAGGVMILLFKPFRIGDYIVTQGEEGTVDDITIINTILITADNRTIYLPNGATFSGIVRNTSKQKNRRVEWIFTTGYGKDYSQAKELLLKLMASDSRILNDPAPFIALNKLGQSSVEIVVRVWVNSDDYWGVFYDLNEVVYQTFPVNELGQPSPQMDVYLHPPKAEDTSSDELQTAVPSSGVAATAVAEAKTELAHSEHPCDASAKPSGGESGK